MNPSEIISYYAGNAASTEISDALSMSMTQHVVLEGAIGSSKAVIAAAVMTEIKGTHVFILNDKESAAYFFNDLENLLDDRALEYARKKVLFYPTTHKKAHDFVNTDKSNALARTEVLNRILSQSKRKFIVTYPEAITEQIVTRKYLLKFSLKLNVGDQIDLDGVVDLLSDYGFELHDFVVQPGHFAVRGGIVDVFSYSNDYPYRIEFFGDEIESVRTFDPVTQLSRENFSRVSILPDIHEQHPEEKEESFLAFMPELSGIWVEDLGLIKDRIQHEHDKAIESEKDLDLTDLERLSKRKFVTGVQFLKDLEMHHLIEFGKKTSTRANLTVQYEHKPQPSFNKNFELLIQDLNDNSEKGIKNIIFSDNPRQIERLYTIFEDVHMKHDLQVDFSFESINIALHEGFIDKQLKLACYTDHQIFERYHRFILKDSFSNKEVLTIKELYNLKPGDFITHIDHGVGRFDGLEKIDNNGRQQEAIRILYKNNDILYISIHSLHRVSKYVGKEGMAPRLDKLGSNAWNRLKNKTKQKVKDIAKELIKLYAERKSSEGFQFAPDSYLQNELEASFIYEDTPDQLKSTNDVKKDMESTYPMDRLICGDVGFGKTEIAIRAAFKAVTDSKQVALLVPTTILALQHYQTFSDRLKELPCTVDYINRFKPPRKQKETLARLKKGEIDILIGTHRLISKDVEFKDLGLLIIDEEQKFGVGAKERLKKIKINVDTLTLTATPIPRTLQFSMMGARDLSIINTAPLNRYPIQTEVRTFSENIIRDAIYYEISRSGQVYFVHNRVQNIYEVEKMLHSFCPDVRIAVAHGQMEGQKLERIMLDFIKQSYDVLLATTIIESGLDIPNVNTIIINDAQNFGLSDLHQLRGRVGRTNKKAFCYMLAPPASVLTPDARRRLKSIEEFSELGSGFNIAMRDLDIRGAGNILGAEQSGFISEIGFEMYQKILDEAIHELKESDFKGLFKEETSADFVRDCQIETDLELMIPDDYITNITERLSLYKELDNTESEDGLMSFTEKLLDRFGPIPGQVQELMNAIRLRWIAKKIGFEKIILKNSKLIGYFISDQASPYYQSEAFNRVLMFVQQNPDHFRMRENNDKLTLTLLHINSVQNAIEALHPIAPESP
ncbi:MAG: transcription-repair coupling factor [Bacteroidota bacterium]|nr:transcription-repair coupling factor [Bacteroidota bacterium]